MIRNRGLGPDGARVVPEAAVASIRAGGDPDRFDKPHYPVLTGWSYGSQWWHSHGTDGGFAARGIHGQLLWVAPEADLVIARFGSHPVAGNAGNDPVSIPMWQAIGRALAE